MLIALSCALIGMRFSFFTVLHKSKGKVYVQPYSAQQDPDSNKSSTKICLGIIVSLLIKMHGFVTPTTNILGQEYANTRI